MDQTENERLKVVLAQVRQDVNEGSSLAKACGAHPKVFDTIFVNMIEAGESSGTLGLVLIKLADLKEAQMRLRSKVRGAMTYPVLMLSVGVILMLVIFTAVIPKLSKVFESMNKPMPPIDQDHDRHQRLHHQLVVLALRRRFPDRHLFLRYIASQKGRPKWDAIQAQGPDHGPSGADGLP